MRIKRKIGIYFLTLENQGVQVTNYDAFSEFTKILTEAVSRQRRVLKFDVSPKKFCVLDNYKVETDHTQIIVEAATHSFRSPLMSNVTVTKRGNPKTLEEGETHKTHVVSYLRHGEAMLLVENSRDGIGILNFIRYLNYLKSLYESRNRTILPYRFAYDAVIRHNFLEELDNLSRVTSTTVYVTKQLLGSEALVFSDRTDPVKSEIKIELTAKPRSNIKDSAIDIFNKYIIGLQTEIISMRVKGRNENNHEILLDTNFMELKEHVTPEKDRDTGEVDSIDLFNQMINIIRG